MRELQHQSTLAFESIFEDLQNDQEVMHSRQMQIEKLMSTMLQQYSSQSEKDKMEIHNKLLEIQQTTQ